MATSFVAVRVGRLLTTDMFTDLGFPVMSFTPVEPYGMQIDLVEDLTAAQIQRAKVRIGTKDAFHEAKLVAAVGALVDLDTLLGTTGTLTGLQLSNAVRGLAADVKGLILWVAKDVIT